MGKRHKMLIRLDKIQEKTVIVVFFLPTLIFRCRIQVVPRRPNLQYLPSCLISVHLFCQPQIQTSPFMGIPGLSLGMDVCEKKNRWNAIQFLYIQWLQILAFTSAKLQYTLGSAANKWAFKPFLSWLQCLARKRSQSESLLFHSALTFSQIVCFAVWFPNDPPKS